MRHRKNFNHLGRKKGHRRAMLANMASSLLLHKRIKTTTAKAKALKMYVEPLITKTKGLTSISEKTHAQRVVFSYLQDKHAVHELFTEIAPKIENRPGGYTRIIKLGNRLGDNAEMCFIELVDFNETMLALKEDSQKGGTRRRRRRGSAGAKKTEGATQTVENKEQVVKAEEVKEETVEEVKTEEAKEEKKIEEPAAEEKKAEAAPQDESSNTEEKKDDEESKKEDSDKKEG